MYWLPWISNKIFPPKKVVFWGATGQAKVLRDAMNKKQYKLVALVDNNVCDSPFKNIPLFLGIEKLDDWLKTFKEPLYCAFAIGGSRGKDRLQLKNQLATRGIMPINIIHKTAFIASDAILGQGCQILAQSAVCASVTIGDCVIINTSANIDHECTIEDGVHIAPGATLAGKIHVKENVFIGAGAVILPNITIGKNAIIGAGAVVTKDVHDDDIVVGNPAKQYIKIYNK